MSASLGGRLCCSGAGRPSAIKTASRGVGLPPPRWRGTGGSVVGGVPPLRRPLRGHRGRLAPVAMINVDLGPSTLLGVALIGGGMTLFGIRGYRPQISRDEDVFFSSVSLLCGGILIFQGWRLDPILLFSQILMSGTAVYFAAENLRMRNAEFEGRSRARSRRRGGRRGGRAAMGDDEGRESEVERRRSGGGYPRARPGRRAGAPAGRPLPPAAARPAFGDDGWEVEREGGARAASAVNSASVAANVAANAAAATGAMDGFVEWDDGEGGVDA